MFYAFKNANGDMVVQIDCDFEDPPELLIEFVKKWEEGYEIVHAVRSKRNKDSYSYLRFIFYRLINLISEDNLPKDVGDFRLCDRKVIKKIIEIDDQEHLEKMINKSSDDFIPLLVLRGTSILMKTVRFDYQFLKGDILAYIGKLN